MRSRAPSVILLALSLSAGGCDSGGVQPCPLGCISSAAGTLQLSCSPNDLSRVIVTGPCSVPDASVESYTGRFSEMYVAIGSPTPGTCHVELVFATGFTYSTDMTFGFQNTGCGCPSYIGPLGPTPLMVDNPSNTCVALDSGAAD